MVMEEAEAILSFWLGELDADGRADKAHVARWFKKDEAFDKEIRDRFADTRARALAGGCDAWLATPRGRLAFIILLDQLSRNMYRGTPEMFSGDALALRAAIQGIDAGEDKALRFHERMF